MAVNINWDRWIFASASTFFKNVINNQHNIQFYIQGQPTRLMGDFVEFRMTGPVYRQQTLTQWGGNITINILVHSTIEDKDFHKIYRLVGIVASAFAQCFPVFKYGNGPDDDSNFRVSECELLKTTGPKDIEVTHYGQIVSDIPEMQSTVEGSYRIDMEN